MAVVTNAIAPPEQLVALIQREISALLAGDPGATQSESYVQHWVEFALVREPVLPRYYIRIGINYHGSRVQHVCLDEQGVLIGWNSGGDALGTGSKAKLLLAGATIFDRDPLEPMMSDTKVGGGCLAPGIYIRIEFKVRGWLGKTKNLAGKQLEKDLDLLHDGHADLLVMCLSETAHLKWRGEGPSHQVTRRTGCDRFVCILLPPDEIGTTPTQRNVDFEGQAWRLSAQRVVGAKDSIMPGAIHFVTLCWRSPDDPEVLTPAPVHAVPLRA